jgi:Uma2 family endonuclease
VVEVLSGSTEAYDRAAKVRRYAALGVSHLWLVDPDRQQLQCFCLELGSWRLVLEAAGDPSVEHPAWPGLTIRLADLWMP